MPSRPHEAGTGITSPSKPPWYVLRLAAFCIIAAWILASLTGCEVVPPKPDDLFVLYRQRMRNAELDKGRSLLTDESKELAQKLAQDHKLNQPPENLALLNILDPAASPVVKKSADTEALLQIRTLRGGLRLLRLTRKDPDSPWRIDMAQDLKSLKAFLEAKAALEQFRDQAIEYAASWKAFNEQIGKIKSPEPPPEPRVAPEAQQETKRREPERKKPPPPTRRQPR
ncbi:MAG: hypothetical protein AB1473_11410 [Thermodesulfobacteriota bacterium]